MPTTRGPQSYSATQESSVDSKITKYEYFLNDVLRSDLKTTLERRDELYAQVSQYMELQNVMEKLLKSSNGGENAKIKTKVDIGSNFYVQAEIPNLKIITVDIGCGIWLPMTSLDAAKFCEKKISFLNSRVDELTKQELNTKAQINIVIEGLRELQRINFEGEPRRRFEA